MQEKSPNSISETAFADLAALQTAIPAANQPLGLWGTVILGGVVTEVLVRGNPKTWFNLGPWSDSGNLGGGGGGGGTAISRVLSESEWTVKTAATGYAVGDRLLQMHVLDGAAPTGTPTIVWRNLTQGTALSTAPTIAHLDPPVSGSSSSGVVPYLGMPLAGGYASGAMTLNTVYTIASLFPTRPAAATGVTLWVGADADTAQIRVTEDGTNPSATKGKLLVGTGTQQGYISLAYDTPARLAQVRLMLVAEGATAGATLEAQFTENTSTSSTPITAPTTAVLNPPYRNEAVTNTPVQVRTGAGKVKGWNLMNNLNPVSAAYLHFWDKATAPVVGTDVPVMTIGITEGSREFQPNGDAQFPFTNGLWCAVLAGRLLTQTTALGQPVHVEVSYE